MEYKFIEISSIYPKRTYRSKRTLKKLHLNEFSEVLVDINLPVSVFDSSKEFLLLDAIYELNSEVFITSDGKNTHIMMQYMSNEFNKEDIIKYSYELLVELSSIDISFAEIENITILYGDAYYGEW